MFSKYFDAIQPGIYSEKAREAIAASASAPMVFQPLKLVSNLGHLTSYMIDGGVIGNNPSIYAY
jgi:patatin-like phospholipase/acyl hydrolase